MEKYGRPFPSRKRVHNADNKPGPVANRRARTIEFHVAEGGRWGWRGSVERSIDESAKLKTGSRIFYGETNERTKAARRDAESEDGEKKREREEKN